MSAAGDAASLFGPTDTAGDPFAAVLGAPVDAGVADSHVGEQPTTASDLFESASNSEAYGQGEHTNGNATNDYAAYSSWYDSTGQSTYSQTATGPATNDYPQQYQAANGWYGDYSSQPSAPNSSQNPAAYSTHHGETASYHSQTYDAYAPSHSTYAPATAAPQTYATQNSTPSTYDAYRPSTQQPSNSYFPSSVYATSGVSSVDSNARQSAPSARETYATSPYVSGSHASQANSASSFPNTPSAPTVSTASYRPKTSNAYDPPLPPPKASKFIAGLHFRPQTTLTPQFDRAPAPSPPPPRRATPMGNAAAVNVSPHRAAHLASQHGKWSGSEAKVGPQAWDSAGSTAIPNGYHHPVQAAEAHTATDPFYPHDPPSSTLYQAKGGSSISPAVGAYSNEAYSNGGAYSNDGTGQAGMIPEDTQYEPSSRSYSPQRVSAGENTLHSSSWAPELSPTRERPSYGPYEHVQSQPYDAPRGLSPDLARSPKKSLTMQYTPRVSNGAGGHGAFDRSPERTKSPGSVSVHSVSSVSRRSTESQRRQGSVSSSRSPPPPHNVHHARVASPYEPAAWVDNERSASPAMSISSLREAPAHDMYQPVRPGAHARAMSYESNLSSTSVHHDPYAPSVQPRRPTGDSFSYADNVSTASQPHDSDLHSLHSYGSQSSGQVLHVPPTHTTYAPSPSLLGTNDPLGRTAARAPVISFGAGGRLLACFHGADSLNTGFDVALASRQSTDIKLYTLHKIIPESALTTSVASYPGPLFADPGTPTTSLVRTGSSAQIKSKKARVIKYLEERVEELSAGMGYLHQGSVERRRAEAKWSLVALLKVMVENDGHLTGSAEIDKAVRASLLPHMQSLRSSRDLVHATSSLSISRTLENTSSSFAGPFTAHGSQEPFDTPVASHVVRSSTLDKIQEHLLRGDRRAACHYAADEKLWAHAMVIASSVDKEIWKDVVTEFVRTELGSVNGKDGLASTRPNGREALRVAYSLYAGQGPSSVMELLPPKALVQHGHLDNHSLQVPAPVPSITPSSPSLPTISPMNLPLEILAQWASTAAMILSNPPTADSSAALTSLGDQLAANHWIEAAHVCYLLSPQTSPVGGLGTSNRIVLVGAPSPHLSPAFFKDPDPIIFSEITEFALSLATPAKGQEPFAGLPHLQPYRLLRAVALAELGHVQLANRYCDAISSSISRASPYFTTTFIEQLKGLSDRLTAAPQLGKSASWMGSKMPKPSLDSIGNYIGNSLTKFIAGDGDSPRRSESGTPPVQDRSYNYSGPFANYSAISSSTSSNVPTPNGSTTDLNGQISSPPLRSGSAMAARSSVSHVGVNRSSSAMDFVTPMARRASPIHRVLSANAATTTFPAVPSYSRTFDGSDLKNDLYESSEPAASQEGSPNEFASHPRVASWWESSDSMEAMTPTASAFVPLSEAGIPVSSSSSGFISLMDDPSISATPTVTSHNSFSRDPVHTFEDEDDDDLGLGNSSTRTRAPQQQQTTPEAKPPAEGPKPSQPVEKPPLQSASSSSSWISRLWGKRDGVSPGPVKANLGEQTSFYYDKELKRWVNKSATAETAQPATPPPPPSRAQTASPSKSTAMSSAHTPPARPATAGGIDLGEPPKKPPMRIRSTLVPDEAGSQTSAASSGPPRSPLSGPPLTPNTERNSPTPAALNTMDGPPLLTGRTKSQAKRPMRSRYVDVFQQQGGSS